MKFERYGPESNYSYRACVGPHEFIVTESPFTKEEVLGYFLRITLAVGEGEPLRFSTNFKYQHKHGEGPSFVVFEHHVKEILRTLGRTIEGALLEKSEAPKEATFWEKL